MASLWTSSPGCSAMKTVSTTRTPSPSSRTAMRPRTMVWLICASSSRTARTPASPSVSSARTVPCRYIRLLKECHCTVRAGTVSVFARFGALCDDLLLNLLLLLSRGMMDSDHCPAQGEEAVRAPCPWTDWDQDPPRTWSHISMQNWIEARSRLYSLQFKNTRHRKVSKIMWIRNPGRTDFLDENGLRLDDKNAQIVSLQSYPAKTVIQYMHPNRKFYLMSHNQFCSKHFKPPEGKREKSVPPKYCKNCGLNFRQIKKNENFVGKYKKGEMILFMGKSIIFLARLGSQFVATATTTSTRPSTRRLALKWIFLFLSVLWGGTPKKPLILLPAFQIITERRKINKGKKK